MENNYLKINDLVRSIQRSAGEEDCFRRGQLECDNRDCIWRSLCLKLPEKSTLICMGVNNNN